MEITHTLVPGGGELHVVTTRSGDRFRLIVEPTGERRISTGDPDDPDTLATITLDHDEADLIAEILHHKSISNQITELERRIERLSQHGGGTPKGQTS